MANYIIQQDTMWLTDEVVNLDADLQIAPGVSLIIQPGAVVNGNGYSIQVFGTLKGTGLVDKAIAFNDTRFLFGSDPAQSGRIEISYANITGGAFLPATGNGSYGSFALTDSTLKSVDGFYIWYPTSSSSFERNLFIDSSGISVGTHEGVQLNVVNNLFYNQLGPAVETWASYGGTSTIVSNNSFVSTDRLALSIPDNYSSASMKAENNYFGTIDINAIERMIYDRNDSFNSASFVSYNPILTYHDSLTPQFTEFFLQQQFGISIRDASDWVMLRLGNPREIYEVCSSSEITSAMLAEIAPVRFQNAEVVEAWLASEGLPSLNHEQATKDFLQQQFGLSLNDARAWVMERLNSPSEIYDICASNNITSAMLADIVQASFPEVIITGVFVNDWLSAHELPDLA